MTRLLIATLILGVGAAWEMTRLTNNSPSMVALVQSALMLPMFLVALPAGGERAATDQMPVQHMARAGAVLTSGVSPTVDDAEQAARASRVVNAADASGLGATTADHAGADAVQQTNGAAVDKDRF